MDQKTRELLAELECFGSEHDAAAGDRIQRLRNITPDTGAFLWVLVRTGDARRVLELGASNGFSAIWLGDALRASDGTLTTVDIDEQRVAMARANIACADLEGYVEVIHEDAALTLEHSADDFWDLIFLDAERDQYVAYWDDIVRSLRPGGLLVVDNAVSHASEMAEFTSLVEAAPNFVTVLVPIGNGELLAYKQ